jgi:hypothetical protein
VSLICDEETCWAPTVNTNELTVEAGDSALLDVHFQNLGRAGEGTVELLVFDVADSTGTYMIALYYAKAENSPTGISATSKKSVSVYPNPAENTLYIKDLDAGKQHKIEVFSIIGVKVFEQNYQGKGIDISSLQPGVYMLKATDENSKTTHAQTFIKK